jgi:hypothetical protein
VHRFGLAASDAPHKFTESYKALRVVMVPPVTGMPYAIAQQRFRPSGALRRSPGRKLPGPPPDKKR